MRASTIISNLDRMNNEGNFEKFSKEDLETIARYANQIVKMADKARYSKRGA